MAFKIGLGLIALLAVAFFLFGGLDGCLPSLTTTKLATDDGSCSSPCSPGTVCQHGVCVFNPGCLDHCISLNHIGSIEGNSAQCVDGIIAGKPWKWENPCCCVKSV